MRLTGSQSLTRSAELSNQSSKPSTPERNNMHTVGIANQKGGVGETTTARHLAFHAIEKGLRTLVVDLDPQANLTRTMRYRLMINSAEVTHTSRRKWDDSELPPIEPSSSSHLLFQNKEQLRAMEIAPGVGLLAGGADLIEVLGWPLDCAQYARSALKNLADQYDICVID